MAKRILLSGVFGPFGVDDEFGRRENIMELFHNQVTKAQGRASLRFHHRSFGLYFLAANVQAPVTVLDFPSRARFEKLLRREKFDAVGISFIVPNFVKAQEMAKMVRRLQPDAEIILGGHGTAIEGIEELIDCDHVVKGEGIRWLRRYLGEDPNAPITHPAMPSAVHKRLFGIPVPGVAGLLVPGVGCVNACRFCATSHFFGKTYTPYFETGEQLYRAACRIAQELPTNEFFVMDENFLKSATRAKELLACMERDQNPLQFGIFSSAETIESFGVENLARMGVYFVWLGAESKKEVYEKNQGRDLKALVDRLRDHGIGALISGILFLEHHTQENLQEDIDYIIGLGGDATQFMQFTPLPGTRLYQHLKEEGRIDFDLPYEEWHGQHLLNWRHPEFSREEATLLIDSAFRQEFDQNSSTPYRMLRTAMLGYRTLSEKGKKDPFLALRAEQVRARGQELRLLIPTLSHFAHNRLERERVAELSRELTQTFGKETAKMKALQAGALALARAQAWKADIFGDLDQPETHLTQYRWGKAGEVVEAIAEALQPGTQDPAVG